MKYIITTREEGVDVEIDTEIFSDFTLDTEYLKQAVINANPFITEVVNIKEFED